MEIRESEMKEVVEKWGTMKEGLVEVAEKVGLGE